MASKVVTWWIEAVFRSATSPLGKRTDNKYTFRPTVQKNVVLLDKYYSLTEGTRQWIYEQIGCFLSDSSATVLRERNLRT